MAIRTTAAAVELIIEVDANISLTPFIEVASNIVDDCCSDSTTYTAAKLELIERWLSAHFYTVRDMRAERESPGRGVEEKFQSKVDLGFDTSHYGQMAMRIDTEGNLGALNNRIKKGGLGAVGVTYLGTEKSELPTITS